MKLKEIAKRLGIENYPEQLELAYERLDELKIDIFSPDALDALEREDSLFILIRAYGSDKRKNTPLGCFFELQCYFLDMEFFE